MDEPRLPLLELFDRLPPQWPEALLPLIQRRAAELGRKVVVLDDDPTGTQTVHDVAVLTEWPVEKLAAELAAREPAFYLLTNSRSLTMPQAQALNAEIGERLRAARTQTGRDFAPISRSDSTLRGHFPGEVAAFAEAVGEVFDAWLIVPYFAEGGRYTVGDIHYVAEGDWLVPAGQTEFARDPSFGYRSSNLRAWVAEKTNGAIPADQVAAITLEELRQGGPEAVTHKLLALPKGALCVVNAASDRDLEVLVLGLLDAEARGKRYLYRTAASFVRVRAGISQQPLLNPADLGLPASGAGLVIAGSYVPRTSAQLEALFNQTQIAAVEARVERLLDDAGRDQEIARVQAEMNRLLEGGQDTAVYTSRALIHRESAESSLAIGQVVSASLVAIVRGLTARPRYLIAKGGITSSDIATQGLGIRRAEVLGQVLPGVPAWRAGPESRFPGLAYIVFPGNVGGPEALAVLVQKFSEQRAV